MLWTVSGIARRAAGFCSTHGTLSICRMSVSARRRTCVRAEWPYRPATCCISSTWDGARCLPSCISAPAMSFSACPSISHRSHCWSTCWLAVRPASGGDCDHAGRCPSLQQSRRAGQHAIGAEPRCPALSGDIAKARLDLRLSLRGFSPQRL